jgi:hypothetical protein
MVAGVDTRAPSDNYKAVLADLELKRLEIEAAIRTIRTLIP